MTVEIGIYEKALEPAPWSSFFEEVAAAGFAFVDLSVDETPERTARLDWPKADRALVRQAAQDSGVEIGGLCLSLHRKIGPGSADPAVRALALDVFRKGIDLCADLGISLLQVAGYYDYYQEADRGAEARYVDTLARGAEYAALAGVMLGLENVDGDDVTSISKGVAICDMVGSAWLGMYPDVGNIAVQGLDAVAELRAGRGRMLAIHLKDARRGEPRRVPMGEGQTDFRGAFAELARQRWDGRLLIEMWNDGTPDSTAIARSARLKVETWLDQAGLQVARPDRRDRQTCCKN
jgi:L-ribulose-5-phosphate 3-epimerase/hexulose-6-phosphate isomerase